MKSYLYIAVVFLFSSLLLVPVAYGLFRGDFLHVVAFSGGISFTALMAVLFTRKVSTDRH